MTEGDSPISQASRGLKWQPRSEVRDSRCAVDNFPSVPSYIMTIESTLQHTVPACNIEAGFPRECHTEAQPTVRQTRVVLRHPVPRVPLQRIRRDNKNERRVGDPSWLPGCMLARQHQQRAFIVSHRRKNSIALSTSHASLACIPSVIASNAGRFSPAKLFSPPSVKSLQQTVKNHEQLMHRRCGDVLHRQLCGWLDCLHSCLDLRLAELTTSVLVELCEKRFCVLARHSRLRRCLKYSLYRRSDRCCCEHDKYYT